MSKDSEHAIRRQRVVDLAVYLAIAAGRADSVLQREELDSIASYLNESGEEWQVKSGEDRVDRMLARDSSPAIVRKSLGELAGLIEGDAERRFVLTMIARTVMADQDVHPGEASFLEAVAKALGCDHALVRDVFGVLFRRRGSS